MIGPPVALRAPCWALVDGKRQAAYYHGIRTEKRGMIAVVYCPQSGYRTASIDSIEPRDEPVIARKGRAG